MTIAAITFGFVAYGCQKEKIDTHSAIDQQDAPVFAKLATEIQNAKSYNNSLALYKDSLVNCTDSLLIIHYNDMLDYYDGMFHQSESLCQTNHNLLNEIHHCDMISECESGMNNMNGNGGMMGSNNGGHDCDIMGEMNDYCGTMDELELTHSQYNIH